MHRSFDEIDEAAEAAADAEGLAQLDAGEGVPHAEVAAWLPRSLISRLTAPALSGQHLSRFFVQAEAPLSNIASISPGL